MAYMTWTTAYNIGVQVRWLDFNDTWLAAEWGHPSDNLGGILAEKGDLSGAIAHFSAALDFSASMSSRREAKSRSARAVKLATYAMPGFELVEELPRWSEPAFSDVLQSLADALPGVSLGSSV